MGEKSSIGLGKPLPPALPAPEQYEVGFEGESDPAQGYNWKLSVKLWTSILVCSGTFIITLTSALFAPAVPPATRALTTTTQVLTLATTLYVLGFSLGPLLWAPLSELSGRRWPLTIGMLGAGIFTLGSAAAKDVQTLLICRFFAGTFGSSQLSVVPGGLADLFDNASRGVAITYYALTVFVGPFVAPFLGAAIVESELGWRWTLYLPAIITLLHAAVCLFFLRETYAPCLLVVKAETLRRQTGNWGIHARQERHTLNTSNLIQKYFTRPLRMLITEPIILLVSLYMSFIYGLVYALLGAYPYVFASTYGMGPVSSRLPFVGLILGQVLACGFVLWLSRSYTEKLVGNKNVPVPEWRLDPPLVGAPIFSAGLFWFGWTAYNPDFHWAVPTAAGIFIGFGCLSVFLPCFNYLVDAYLPLAASVVAANIMLRSAVAASYPLFSVQMFENLGTQWACTLLGSFSVVMIPIPFAFKAYGPRLRRKS